MTNLELAKQIVSLLGGKENVVKAANCMTRLRVTCRNTELVDKDQIKALEGVLGLVNEGDYYQIILGPGKAKKVTDICVEELDRLHRCCPQYTGVLCGKRRHEADC